LAANPLASRHDERDVLTERAAEATVGAVRTDASEANA
jgi:hypothetical protein